MFGAQKGEIFQMPVKQKTSGSENSPDRTASGQSNPIIASLRAKQTKTQNEEEEIFKAYNKKQNNGHWRDDENRKYLKFLLRHRQKFQQRNVRRIGKIFKLMGKSIRSRNAIQCRSHHQKMEKKFSTLNEILAFLGNIIENDKMQCPAPIIPTELTTQCQSSPIFSCQKSTLENDIIFQQMPMVLQPEYGKLDQAEIRFYSFFNILINPTQYN